MTHDSAVIVARARELRAAGEHDQARALLAARAAEAPDDAELRYETACVHDFLGLEAQAVPHYIEALRGDLPEALRRSAYTGLGSTYRTLGRYTDAERVLTEGARRFPQALEIQAFLALTQHNLGHSAAAVETLLQLLAQTSADPGIRAYAQALAFYAQDVDRVWL